jgi:hypothetical protein
LREDFLLFFFGDFFVTLRGRLTAPVARFFFAFLGLLDPTTPFFVAPAVSPFLFDAKASANPRRITPVAAAAAAPKASPATLVTLLVPARATFETALPADLVRDVLAMSCFPFNRFLLSLRGRDGQDKS